MVCSTHITRHKIILLSQSVGVNFTSCPAFGIISLRTFSRLGRVAQSLERLSYGLDGPGIKSWLGVRFSAVQTGPGAHPASCTMDTGSFPGVKSGRGVKLTPHHLLVPRSKNRIELYFYSP